MKIYQLIAVCSLLIAATSENYTFANANNAPDANHSYEAEKTIVQDQTDHIETDSLKHEISSAIENVTSFIKAVLYQINISIKAAPHIVKTSNGIFHSFQNSFFILNVKDHNSIIDIANKISQQIQIQDAKFSEFQTKYKIDQTKISASAIKNEQTLSNIVAFQNDFKSIYLPIIFVIDFFVSLLLIYLLIKFRSFRIDISHIKSIDPSIDISTVLLRLADLADLKRSIPTEQSPDEQNQLIIKLANEVSKLEMNLIRMDPSVKGHKQLTRCISRIKDNLLANDYEIVEMINQKYDEGLNADANFIDDDTLEKGSQIITNIKKPQINFKGKMIQAAEISVSRNI